MRVESELHDTKGGGIACHFIMWDTGICGHFITSEMNEVHLILDIEAQANMLVVCHDGKEVSWKLIRTPMIKAGNLIWSFDSRFS